MLTTCQWVRIPRLLLVLVPVLILSAARVEAATPLAAVTLVTDISVSLGGGLARPDTVIRDQGGLGTVVLSGLPAPVAAYHRGGAAHWLVFDNAVVLPGGLIVTPRDVVAWDGTNWSVVLQGASVGIPAGVRIDALASRDDHEVLLSLDTSAALGGVAVVGPADIVRHDAGGWSLFWSAGAAGLGPGQNVDGLDVLGNGHLLFSLDSAGTVGGVRYQADDILEYVAGTWSVAYAGASRFPVPTGVNLRDFSVTAAAGPLAGSPPIMHDVPDQALVQGQVMADLWIGNWVTPTDGDPILNYAYTGALPPGLNFQPATGRIWGSPAAAGSYSLQVSAADKDGSSSFDALLISVSAAPGGGTPPVLGNVPDRIASVGVPMVPLLLAPYVQATDGDPVLDYGMSGTLPPGLVFDPLAGAISGSPTQAGSWMIQVQARDKDGFSNGDALTIAVQAGGQPAPNGSIAEVPVAGTPAFLMLALLLGAWGALGMVPGSRRLSLSRDPGGQSRPAPPPGWRGG